MTLHIGPGGRLSLGGRMAVPRARVAAPPPASPYDPDATALFARFGVEPDDDRKQLISDRFEAGKALSFWAKLDALWVHAAHDAESARLNWLGDRFNCIPVNNPSFQVDRGYMGDGSSSYLDTQFDPAAETDANHTQNSGSFGIRSNSENAGTGSLAGYFFGDGVVGNGTTINPRTWDGSYHVRLNQAQGALNVTPPNPTSRGMFVASRTAADRVMSFRDGEKVADRPIPSVAPPSGFYRLGGISDTSYRACQFSMGFVGGGLQPDEVAELHAWFEPYRQALGVT